MAAMIEARRKTGASIVNISMLPAAAGELTARRSASIQGRVPIAEHVCEAIYVVLPLNSDSRDKWTRHAAPSDTITRVPVEMCESVRMACDRAAARVGLNASELFDEAHARGMIIEG